MLRSLKFSFLEKYKEYGVIFIRLIVGFHLIYGTQDNAVSYYRELSTAVLERTPANT